MSSRKYRAGRTAGVTLAMVEKRNRCIVALHLSGLTIEQILEVIRDLQSVFHWGNICSTRQVQRVLSRHFEGRPMNAREVKDCSFGLRDAALNEMEKCVEDIALFAFSIKHSQPSEYLEAIKAQAEILQMIVDVRGFNMSRANYGKWEHASEHGMRKYRQAIERAGGKHALTEKLLNKLDLS